MAVIKCEKTDKNTVELEISVGRELFAPALERSFAKNSQKITIPGFRKGKAPRKMIIKMYGEGYFFEDAVNELYPEAYRQAIEEKGLEPVDRADISISDIDENGFTFTAKVTVKPEVTLEGYTGIEAYKPAVEVTAEDVEAELERRRKRNGKLENVERAAKSGDTVILDYEGFNDGVPFDGGKAEAYSLVLGSGQFIPGFEEQLEGMEIGQDGEVNVTFPEHYHSEELAGKPVVFKVHIHEIKENILPELDDEFAKDVSEFDTLDELRADIMKKLQETRAASAEHEFEEEVMRKLADKVKADIPAVMIEQQLSRLLEDFSYRLSSQGMTLENYMKMTGSDIESFKENFRPQAEHQVKVRLALETIAKLEGFTVTDEEIDAEYVRMCENYKMKQDELEKYIDRSAVREDKLMEKAGDFVKESAVALDKKPEPEAVSDAASDAE